MTHRLSRYANKLLSLTLIASILAVGGFAVSLTHVYVTFSVSFGKEPPKPYEVAVNEAMQERLAVALPIKQFDVAPVPARKPSMKGN